MRGRGLKRKLLPGFTALVFLSFSATAAASWGTEQRLFKPQSTGWLNLGVATDGGAIALWATAPADSRRYSIRYATRPADASAFGSSRTLQRNLSRDLSFGMSETGIAVVQFSTRDGRLVLARLEPGVGLIGRSTIASNVKAADLDVADDGTAVSVYETDGQVYSRTAIAGRRFNNPDRLEPPRSTALPEEIAAGPDGRGVIAWSGRRDEVFAAQQLDGGGFGPAQKIPNAPFPSGGMDLAASAKESFVLINAPDQHPEPLVAVARPGERFEAAEALKTSGAARGSFGLIDVDAAGNAVAAWQRSSLRSGGPRGADVATRPAGGSFTNGRAVFDGRGSLDSLDVASDGGVVMSFNKNVANQTGDFDQQLLAVVRPPRASFLPPERVGSVLSKNGLIESVVATAAGAEPTIIWSEPGDAAELGVLASQFLP